MLNNNSEIIEIQIYNNSSMSSIEEILSSYKNDLLIKDSNESILSAIFTEEGVFEQINFRPKTPEGFIDKFLNIELIDILEIYKDNFSYQKPKVLKIFAS